MGAAAREATARLVGSSCASGAEASGRLRLVAALASAWPPRRYWQRRAKVASPVMSAQDLIALEAARQIIELASDMSESQRKALIQCIVLEAIQQAPRETEKQS